MSLSLAERTAGRWSPTALGSAFARPSEKLTLFATSTSGVTDSLTSRLPAPPNVP